MTVSRYRIAASRIAGARHNLFLEVPIESGLRITAPVASGRVYKWTDSRKLADAGTLLPASRDASLERGS